MDDKLQDYADKIKEKNRSNDRIIILKKRENKNTLNTKGMIDNRLFSGENKLHCVADTQTGLWTLHFDKGNLPGGLDQSFTSFGKALFKVKDYFSKRNIDVDKVMD